MEESKEIKVSNYDSFPVWKKLVTLFLIFVLFFTMGYGVGHQKAINKAESYYKPILERGDNCEILNQLARSNSEETWKISSDTQEKLDRLIVKE